jgi:hypothetical protein
MTSDDPRDQQPGLPGDGPPEAPSTTAPSATASADELASAVLDGELRGEAAAAAQRRPDVAARLAALRTARSSLRDAPAPPPDPEARERAVAAALASFDEAGTSAPPAGRTAQRSGQVADLGSRRGARRQRVPRWLGAAAAAALIGAGVASLAVFGSSSSDSDDSRDTATAALDESNEGGAEESSGGGEAPEATTDSGADREAADAYGTAVDLGTFDSADALADEVGSVLARTESDGASSGAPAAGETASTLEGADSDLTAACPSALAAASAAPDATTVLRGRALVAGVAVDVWVVETPGSRRLVAVDGACGIVTDRELG